MEQTTLTPSRCFVRDLADGQEVNEVFVVRGHTRRQRRNGEPFLKLQLGDTTGAVEAVIWDEVEALAPICPTGSVIRILGRYAGRFIPFIGAPIGAIQNGSVTRQLGERSLKYYARP